MNYRHAYHAGNFADVVKHAVLVRCILYLQRKDKAFRVIDTHSGPGLYDLSGGEASKTGEWHGGIGRLLEADLPPEAGELLAPYLEIVAPMVREKTPLYPGSPLIARKLLRKQDRLSAIELHSQDAKRLADLFEGDFQVRVTELDGWLALGAHLPPKEKRGMVMVDPPFEKEGEFTRLADGLEKAHKRWPGGTYMLWFPVKDRAAMLGFRTRLATMGLPDTLWCTLDVRDTGGESLDGCGIALVNPPFTLENELKVLLPALQAVLETAAGAGKHEIARLCP